MKKLTKEMLRDLASAGINHIQIETSDVDGTLAEIRALGGATWFSTPKDCETDRGASVCRWRQGSLDIDGVHVIVGSAAVTVAKAA